MIVEKTRELATLARTQARDPLTPLQRVGQLMDLADLLEMWIKEWMNAEQKRTIERSASD